MASADRRRKRRGSFPPELEALLRQKFIPAVPSIEELLHQSIDRHQAFLAGQKGALLTELNRCIQAAFQDLLKQKGRLAGTPFPPEFPVAIPFWAAMAVYQLATMSMVEATHGRGKHARWMRQYRDDLIHWHRYASVKEAIRKRQSTYTDDRVYHVVAKQLKGSEFESGWRGIKASHSLVSQAIKAGQQARFFPSGPMTVVSLAMKNRPPQNSKDSQD